MRLSFPHPLLYEVVMSKVPVLCYCNCLGLKSLTRMKAWRYGFHVRTSSSCSIRSTGSRDDPVRGLVGRLWQGTHYLGTQQQHNRNAHDKCAAALCLLHWACLAKRAHAWRDEDRAARNTAPNHERAIQQRAESIDSARPQPGAFSVPEAEEKIRINSSRPRNSGGFVRRIERSAGVIGDSVTGVTSSWASCGVRAFTGTRGSDDDAVPEISSGSRSLYSVRGLFVNPIKRSNSRGSGRHKRGSYRPYRGP